MTRDELIKLAVGCHWRRTTYDYLEKGLWGADPREDCTFYLSWREAPFPLSTDECHHFDAHGETCTNKQAPEFLKTCPWGGNKFINESGPVSQETFNQLSEYQSPKGSNIKKGKD